MCHLPPSSDCGPDSVAEGQGSNRGGGGEGWGSRVSSRAHPALRGASHTVPTLCPTHCPPGLCPVGPRAPTAPLPSSFLHGSASVPFPGRPYAAAPNGGTTSSFHPSIPYCLGRICEINWKSSSNLMSGVVSERGHGPSCGSRQVGEASAWGGGSVHIRAQVGVLKGAPPQ